MSYFEGFIAPVPDVNRDAYLKHSAGLAPLLQECGVGRMVESWEDQIPDGELTDFRKAVDAKPNEKVVFSWFEYPGKAERDASSEKFMSDPRLKDMGANVPFDARRMIFGGFEAIVDEGAAGGGRYTDGFVVPVQHSKRDEYQALASQMAEQFREYGATRVVEAFSNDVPGGEVTDFYRAVKAEDGEGVVFSFIEWPDKQTRDQAWGKIMAGERHRPLPFDGKRMFWGGFKKILDTAKPQLAQQATLPA